MAAESDSIRIAGSILRRAVELDSKQRFTEALVCYQEGLQLLLEALRSSDQDESKKLQLRERCNDYMNRAEQIKKHVEKEKKAGSYHEQITITDNSTGHSYQKLFGRFLDETVTKVEVEDPYIRSIHQVYNFLRLAELFVKSCPKLRKISLLTGKDKQSGAASQQDSWLKEIETNLKNHNITLLVTFSDTLHDREIRLDNGWVIKIGRGLDYFKAPTSKLSIGFCDMDLRPCHSTTVDIFHVSRVRFVQE